MRLAAAFALAAVGLTAAAADKKPAKVDWGDYVDHAKLAGEVTKLTDTGFVLKVARVVRESRTRVRVDTESVDLAFHDNGLVRWAKQPPKLDARGKKVSYTDKELRELRQPAGAPGFAADRSDLARGAKVEVHLLRPKGVAADKLVSTDYKVKYVLLPDAPARPKADTKPKDDDEPKGNKKGRGDKKP